jgi:RHS repeat-associated protein
LTASYTYDAYGNVTETDISATSLTTRVQQASFASQNYEFPISSTAVVSGTLSLISGTTWRYDLGIPTVNTDPNGNQTVVPTTAYDGAGGYDGFGRLHQQTRPDGSASVWTYAFCTAVGPYCPTGAAYEMTTLQLSSGITPTAIVTGYTAYDTRSRVIEQGTVLLGGVISRVHTTYDQMGNVAKFSKPYIGSSPVYSTSYIFDLARSRVTETDVPQDQSDTCAPCQNVTTSTYSGFTVTATQTVSNSASSSTTHVTQQIRDALGEMLSTVDSASGNTAYNYDAFGNLVATEDADSHITTISYDGLGHKIGMTDPNMGTWSYQVDALGEVLCQTDAKGQSIIAGYDNIGREVSKLETAAGAGCSATSGTSSSWTYDTATHGLGLLASLTDSNGFERDYAYESLSRSSDVTTTPGTGASAYTTSTSYDSFGRVQTTTYPESVTPASGGSTPTAVATITSGPVNTGTVITLTGTSSTDPNSLGLQYQWSQTGGPVLTAGAFDPATAITTFTPSFGGSYSFQLQVIDSGSGLSAPATVSITVKPLAPSSAPTLSVNPSINGNVTVSWTAVSGVDSYTLYQSTDGTTYTSIQTGITGTSTPVTGLSNGTYYYKVASVGGGVTGDKGSASAALTVTLPPGAPTGMTVSPAHQLPSTNYTASWTAPASGTVTTYQLLEDNNSGFTSPTTYTITAPTHSKVRSEATVGTYYYKARACNGTACSAYSGVDNVVVMNVPSAPSASASPSSITSGDNSTLSWTSTAGSGGTYTAQASLTTTFTSPTTAYSGSGTSVTVSPNVTKHYRVEACNDVGCSSWRSTVTITVTIDGGGGGFVTPKAKGPTDAPTLFAAVMPELGGIQVDEPKELSPLADVAVEKLTSVQAPARSVKHDVLAQLRQTREAVIVGQLSQPSEAALQARFDAAQGHPVAQNLVLASDNTHPLAGKPVYAAPVYQAYAGLHRETAGGTPFRFVVQYNYDPASGALESVSNADTGFLYWRAAIGSGVAPVDAFGHIIGYVDGNNVSTVIAYDQATGATLGIGTGIGTSTAIQQLAYSWDGFGNLKQRCDANKGLTEAFGYDGLNRFTASTVKTGATACAGGSTGAAIGMTYDAIGNIQTRTNTGITVGAGTLSDTYTYGNSSHPYAVTGVTSISGTYAYDANGDMTSGNGRSITWDDDNLPTAITSTSTVNGNNVVTGSSAFSYSPDMKRYQQVTTDSVAGNSTTVYIGGLLEVVTTSAGTQYRHNIIANGNLLAVHTLDQSGNATTAYIHSDHLGSSDALTDDTGAVAQQMSFDTFGLRRDPANWTYDLTGTQISLLKNKTDHGFTSQEQLDSVALVHMSGRVYDPSIGRMISADPTIPMLEFSQAFNRYSYVYNNPLGYIDPDGFDPTKINVPASRTPGFPTDIGAQADVSSFIRGQFSSIQGTLTLMTGTVVVTVTFADGTTAQYICAECGDEDPGLAFNYVPGSHKDSKGHPIPDTTPTAPGAGPEKGSQVQNPGSDMQNKLGVLCGQVSCGGEDWDELRCTGPNSTGDCFHCLRGRCDPNPVSDIDLNFSTDFQLDFQVDFGDTVTGDTMSIGGGDHDTFGLSSVGDNFDMDLGLETKTQ